MHWCAKILSTCMQGDSSYVLLRQVGGRTHYKCWKPKFILVQMACLTAMKLCCPVTLHLIPLERRRPHTVSTQVPVSGPVMSRAAGQKRNANVIGMEMQCLVPSHPILPVPTPYLRNCWTCMQHRIVLDGISSGQPHQLPALGRNFPLSLLSQHKFPKIEISLVI